MRRILIAVMTLVSGCSTMLQPVSTAPSANHALLVFRDANNKPFGKLDGLWYVDEHRFKEPRNRIYIALGQHSVGYQCPGWMSWDDYASLKYKFEAGKSYEMVCEDKGPVIYALPEPERGA